MPTITSHGGNELITADVYKIVDLQSGMTVADLGCGNLGFFTLPAAKIVGKNGIVYAVDIMKSTLQSVESRALSQGLSNIKTVWSNLELIGATKIDAGSVDVAFLKNILFQSKRHDLIIKEATRLLKTGGKLLIIDWMKISTPFGPSMTERIDPEDTKQHATEAGLTLAQEFQAGPYHFGLLFTK
ncbi:MAG: methyltransferase domain-containing protein [bacterium]